MRSSFASAPEVPDAVFFRGVALHFAGWIETGHGDRHLRVQTHAHTQESKRSIFGSTCLHVSLNITFTLPTLGSLV